MARRDGSTNGLSSGGPPAGPVVSPPCPGLAAAAVSLCFAGSPALLVCSAAFRAAIN